MQLRANCLDSIVFLLFISFKQGDPSFSMYYAMFKEQIGDAPGARALFVEGSSNSTSEFYMNINRLANMEKRMVYTRSLCIWCWLASLWEYYPFTLFNCLQGNAKAATEIYENAIQDAMQKNTEVLPDLYANFAQFKYAVGNRGLSTDFKYYMYILLLRHLTGIRCYLNWVVPISAMLSKLQRTEIKSG